MQRYEKQPPNAYRWVFSQMREEGDLPELAVRVTLNLTSARLDEAVWRLGEAAKLRICYPWGRQGGDTLDPATRVSLDVRDVPLAEALAQIAQQLDWPAVRWAKCKGVSDTIFSVRYEDASGSEKGLEFFPLLYRETPLMDPWEVRDDPVLGPASTSPVGQQGRPLGDIAFTARELDLGGQRRPIQEGQDGPLMFVRGPRPGRLLWQLVQADPAHAPETVTDEIRQQVISDLKIKAAFEQAKALAAKVTTPADLDAFVQEHELKDHDLKTDWFARMEIAMAFFRRYYRATDLVALGIPVPAVAPALRTEFLAKAFSLAPDDPDKPYPRESQKALMVPLPASRVVTLIQRIDYQPPKLAQYIRVRASIIAELTGGKEQLGRGRWFTQEHVLARTGFKRRRG
jgi:hypothetical protein